MAPAVAILALAVTAAAPASAQSNATQDTIGALGNLFGALAQAGAKAKAQKSWAQINPQVAQCVNIAFSGKKITVDQLVAAGLTPEDQRVAPLITFCNAVLTTELKTNFSCTTPNAQGQQVPTMCSEIYARDENGGFTQLTQEDFIRAVGASEKATVATLETTEANAARLQIERQQAEAARQRFLASPEGKRQAAAEAARIRLAEAARQRAAIAEAARAKQARIQAAKAAASAPAYRPPSRPAPRPQSTTKSYIARYECWLEGFDNPIKESRYFSAESDLKAMNEARAAAKNYWPKRCDIVSLDES